MSHNYARQDLSTAAATADKENYDENSKSVDLMLVKVSLDELLVLESRRF